jgi:hypothetical protein
VPAIYHVPMILGRGRKRNFAIKLVVVQSRKMATVFLMKNFARAIVFIEKIELIFYALEISNLI